MTRCAGEPERVSSCPSAGNRTSSDVPIHQAQRREQVLRLLDAAAEIVLGVHDQERVGCTIAKGQLRKSTALESSD